MNLDNYSEFPKIDLENMIAQIDALPDQLKDSWRLGNQFLLPDWTDIEHVLIAGMGGSAIGADLLKSYISPVCIVGVEVHRDYGLPSWVSGPETLVIASSHSGNTEETLSALKTAVERKCRVLAVTTGGKIEEFTRSIGAPVWRFTHSGQPRSAVGFSFGLLLSAFYRLKLVPNPSDELEDAVRAMVKQQVDLQIEVPVVNNPAKRIAGQLAGRWVTVLGAGLLAPVARRWKGQLSEVAKAWAQFEFLPEANHNTLAGIQHPEHILSNMAVIFLASAFGNPRNALRLKLSRDIFMLEGIGTDVIESKGGTRLAHQWTSLHFGDYVAYYLAMMYDVDPTPVAVIENFKRGMLEADTDKA
ncbi:MAG: bifunctional phosphoglucose/phosphomannose isomerase [Anaerolineales bacterium]|jgi:glucose/mannose-6-phosphate isomerase